MASVIPYPCEMEIPVRSFHCLTISTGILAAAEKQYRSLPRRFSKSPKVRSRIYTVGTAKNLVKRPDCITFHDPIHVEEGQQFQATGAQDGCIHDVHLAEHMVERQEAEGNIGLGRAFGVGHAVSGKMNAFVGQHDPFGHAGGAPGVENRGLLSTFPVERLERSMSKKVDLAGNPGNLDPAVFFALRFLGLPLGAVFIWMDAVASPGSFMDGKGLLFGIPAAIFGFYLPDMLLQSRIDRRQKEIHKAMPDALDLLTICVEAGLGFDAAMSRVYEHWDNELARALGQVVREIQLGKLRREALRDMADRMGIVEMTSFVAAVIQSESLGVSLAQVLRIQSDQMHNSALVCWLDLFALAGSFISSSQNVHVGLVALM